MAQPHQLFQEEDTPCEYISIKHSEFALDYLARQYLSFANTIDKLKNRNREMHYDAPLKF